MKTAARLLFTLTIGLTSVAARGETYVVPIWTSNLPSAEGRWVTQVMAHNRTAHPVTYRVTGAYPLTVVDCLDCLGVVHSRTIEPGASLPVGPGDSITGKRMTAGAFSVESDGPLLFDIVAYRDSVPEFRQRLDVAHGWLEPGAATIAYVARGSAGWRANAFVVNPTESSISVRLWMGRRVENEITTSIPPKSMRIVTMPEPTCNGLPCPRTGEFPPEPIALGIESSGPALVSVSALDHGWAIFSLPEFIRQ